MNPELFNINTLLSALIGLFMIYLNFRFTVLKEKIQELKTEIDTVKEENDEIRINYLSKFDKISEEYHKGKEEIIREFGKINLLVERQLSYCAVIQEAKKKENSKIEMIEVEINKLKERNKQ